MIGIARRNERLAVVAHHCQPFCFMKASQGWTHKPQPWPGQLSKHKYRCDTPRSRDCASSNSNRVTRPTDEPTSRLAVVLLIRLLPWAAMRPSLRCGSRPCSERAGALAATASRPGRKGSARDCGPRCGTGLKHNGQSRFQEFPDMRPAAPGVLTPDTHWGGGYWKL